MNIDDTCPRISSEIREKDFLAETATLSTDCRATNRQFPFSPDDVRMEFHRDYTRIIHSRPFRRLRQKTQVFISPKNDHLCTRMEHSLHVASVATTIARALRLNEDLVNAIAVGHDLGHAPFGHKGEKSLDTIAKKHGLTFSHELHSLRVVDYLEPLDDEHHGLNLTFAVRDGIACHYGEKIENLSPDRDKPDDSLATMQRGKALPSTLEGCVVRWADKVAYLGRDFEDAVELGLLNRGDLPSDVTTVLGKTNTEIIASLVSELTRNDPESDSLEVSDEVYNAINTFYKFSIEKYIRQTLQQGLSSRSIGQWSHCSFFSVTA